MKLWLIAKSNMKKKKSNVVILFVLITLATVLLYTSISVLRNVYTFMDTKNEEQNGAHVSYTVSRKYSDQVEGIIKNTQGYKSSEKKDDLLSVITAEISNPRVDEPKEMMQFFFMENDERDDNEINQYKILDKAKKWTENSIIVPSYLKLSKGYKTGDTLKLTFDDRKYTFKIYGFLEDVMYAVPSNMPVYRCKISPEYFKRLSKDSAMRELSTINVRVKNVDKDAEFSKSVGQSIKKEITNPDFAVYFGLEYNTMKSGTAMFVNILMGILLIFAILIIVIAMLVIRFSIYMSIENNLPNIGITEALGYTSGQMQIASVMEYMLISGAGILAGLALSGVCAQFMAGIVSSSIGLSWKMNIDVISLIITIGVTFVMICLMSLLTSMKYRHITPLEALRGGVSTHSFRKNHFPLSKGRLSLNSTLGLKGILQNKRQNISIMIIVSLLTFTCIMMLGIYYNFVVDDKALGQLVGLERPNIQLSNIGLSTGESDESIEEIKADLLKESEIDEILTTVMSDGTVSLGKKNSDINLNFYSNCKKLKVNTCIEGRYPKHDNEILLTNMVMDELGAKLGNTITMECQNTKKSFVVVGIGQQISYMGKCGTLTLDAMYRIHPEYIVSNMNIYVKNGSNVEDMVEKLGARYKDDKYIQIVNFDQTYDTIIRSFTTSLSMLSVVFVILTIAVIILIIFLVVKMKIAKERRSVGVYKALGYTTKQIVWQNVMSFAPVISIGGMVGVIVGKLFVNNAFVVMLSVCGIKNASLIVAPALLAGIFITIVGLAFVVSIICSMGVRKIEPYKMITE